MNRLALTTSAVALASGFALTGAMTFAATQTDTEAFRDAVTVGGIRAHQEALQDIADGNGGTRASGTPGYDASVTMSSISSTTATSMSRRRNSRSTGSKNWRPRHCPRPRRARQTMWMSSTIS